MTFPPSADTICCWQPFEVSNPWLLTSDSLHHLMKSCRKWDVPVLVHRQCSGINIAHLWFLFSSAPEKKCSRILSWNIVDCVICWSLSSWNLPNAHSLKSLVPPLWDTTCTMTWCSIQVHYPDTDLTSPCPILVMPSARLGSDQYKFGKLLALLD